MNWSSFLKWLLCIALGFMGKESSCQEVGASLEFDIHTALSYPILSNVNEEYLSGTEQDTRLGFTYGFSTRTRFPLSEKVWINGALGHEWISTYYLLDGLSFGTPNNNRTLTTQFVYNLVQFDVGFGLRILNEIESSIYVGYHHIYSVDNESKINTEPSPITINSFSTNKLRRNGVVLGINSCFRLMSITEKIILGVVPKIEYRFVRGSMALATGTTFDLLNFGVGLRLAFSI